MRIAKEYLLLVAIGLLIGWGIRIPGIDNLPQSPRSIHYEIRDSLPRPLMQPQLSLAEERREYIKRMVSESRKIIRGTAPGTITHSGLEGRLAAVEEEEELARKQTWLKERESKQSKEEEMWTKQLENEEDYEQARQSKKEELEKVKLELKEKQKKLEDVERQISNFEETERDEPTEDEITETPFSAKATEDAEASLLELAKEIKKLEEEIAREQEQLRSFTLPVPLYLYGTAWKKERTADLVVQAVKAGFRGIDTANQPRHYQEALVGQALQQLFQQEVVTREELFIQTKFTHTNGQDPNNIPYDAGADVTTQVQQSFHSTLQHLSPVTQVDSYVLHGPSVGGPKLGPLDWQAWRQMESIQKDGGAKYLGISNVNIDQLKDLVDQAEVPPTFVQNRCFANTGWDMPVRKYCDEKGIFYQGFSVLTANQQVVHHPKVEDIAKRLGVLPEQVVFKFAMELGILPITGTTTQSHMELDLDVLNWSEQGIGLSEDEISWMETGFMH